jgi:hypothetical protein
MNWFGLFGLSRFSRCVVATTWLVSVQFAVADDLPLYRRDYPDEEFDGAEAVLVNLTSTVPGAAAASPGFLERGRTYAGTGDAVSAILGGNAAVCDLSTTHNITTPPDMIDSHPTLGSTVLGGGAAGSERSL